MATAPKQPPHGSVEWFHRMVSLARQTRSVVTEVVTLTPALATELLRHNPSNRFLRVAKLEQLTGDIRAGRWSMNGEPIIIAENGELNDGQHRANAVIETNISIETLMVFGVSRASRTTVDQGAARSAGDYMSMDGVENATSVAAIGRMLIAFEDAGGKSLGDSSRVSAGEVIARYAKDDVVARAATFCSTTHRYCRRFVAPSIIGFCYVLMWRISPDQTETYLRQVAVGEGIKKSDPAFAVREGLLRDKLTRTERIHLIFRGWNAFRQRRTLTLAKVSGKDNLPALI